jgi:hypothetical protein
MSILQADGLEFGDGSILESLYGIIPQDKRMVFYQAAAPTGWTKLTQVSAPGDLDGSAIRVTSGSGGSVVGTTDFTSAMPATPKAFDSVSPAIAAGSVGPHTLTLSELASHDHQIGVREVDDGPPAPTAYQAPAQASYPDRVPYTAQRAYQQPSVYQQPIIYQQPSAYQQPQSRQTIVPVQNPGTYRQPKNPISQEPYQQPTTIRNRVFSNQNRRVNRTLPQSPSSTNATGQVSVQVGVSNAQVTQQPVRYREPGRRRNNIPNPNNARAQRPSTTRVRPGNRPDRRRNRRGPRRNRQRRQPRAQVSRQNPNPFSFQVPSNFRGAGRRRNQVFVVRTNFTQSFQPVQGPGPIRVNRQSPDSQQQNRVFSFQQQNPTPQRNPKPESNPNPFTVPAPFRNPSTFRRPSNTTVTANTRVTGNTNVNANTNVPVRVTQVYQQSNINYSPYPQPLIVPGDQIRGDNTNAPNTSSVGGGNAHTHPFTGDDFGPQITAPSGFSLRVQYIDVIVCSFD